MRPASSDRDTLITFRSRVGTQSEDSGAWSYTWADIEPKEWAEVQDILPSKAEGVSENIDITRKPCRIRCTYRTDVDGTMRVTFDGRELEIVSGPVMLGRREGLEMVCAELSTKGEAP